LNGTKTRCFDGESLKLAEIVFFTSENPTFNASFSDNGFLVMDFHFPFFLTRTSKPCSNPPKLILWVFLEPKDGSNNGTFEELLDELEKLLDELEELLEELEELLEELDELKELLDELLLESELKELLDELFEDFDDADGNLTESEDELEKLLDELFEDFDFELLLEVDGEIEKDETEIDETEPKDGDADFPVINGGWDGNMTEKEDDFVDVDGLISKSEAPKSPHNPNLSRTL